MDCTTHIEADFYTTKIHLARVELCCHCAGEFEFPVEKNTSLRAPPEGPYFIGLPICQVCLENGCNMIVRAARRHARAKQAILDVAQHRVRVGVKIQLFFMKPFQLWMRPRQLYALNPRVIEANAMLASNMYCVCVLLCTYDLYSYIAAYRIIITTGIDL